jgi:hypothetical protein
MIAGPARLDDRRTAGLSRRQRRYKNYAAAQPPAQALTAVEGPSMNASSDTPASKGMMMVAAYRAARLTQRPVLRTGLQHSHLARRVARGGGLPVIEAELQAPPQAPPPAPTIAAAPKTPDPGSVFASLVNTAVAQRQSEAPQRDIGAPEAATVEPAKDADHPHCTDVSEALLLPPAADIDQPMPATPTLVAAPLYDPPLAEIGFGPGMLIRLSQLGLHTTADLAQANAEHLRSELGDISRLVDVEAWISSARQTAHSASR